jgi:hypothetical protein
VAAARRHDPGPRGRPIDTDLVSDEAVAAISELDEIQIAQGGFLKLTADQANGLHLSVEGVQSAGLAVRITGIGDDPFDFSGITTAGSRVVAEVIGAVDRGSGD